MNAYRMYAHANLENVTVDLAHGFPGQAEHAPFSNTFLISDLANGGPLSLLRFLVRSRRWLRRHAADYDIFHGINVFENTIEPAHWASRFGLTTFVSPQNHGSGLASARGLRQCLRLPERRRKLVKSLDGVIAISSDIEDELLEYGIKPERLHFIPNGIDRERFRPAIAGEKEDLRKFLGWDPSVIVMLFVGGLSNRKRPDWMFRISELAAKRGHQIHSVFVGPEREAGVLNELKKKAADATHLPEARFYGHTERVEDFYRAADIFCLPSQNEGMSVAMLEAMASGLPTLTCRISGATDVIQSGKNGFLIDSPQEGADCIDKLCNDRMLWDEIATAARLRTELFSLDTTWQLHERMFRNSIRGKQRG